MPIEVSEKRVAKILGFKGSNKLPEVSGETLKVYLDSMARLV